MQWYSPSDLCHISFCGTCVTGIIQTSTYHIHVLKCSRDDKFHSALSSEISLPSAKLLDLQMSTSCLIVGNVGQCKCNF